MACSNNQTNNTLGNLGLDENYICCCNDRFTFNLDPIGDGRYTLTCTPCSLPTAVFDVATISVRQNSCNQIEYYQAAINTDPVKIIQDCSLRDLLCRCINWYFDDATLPNCNTNRRNFGLF